MLCCCKSGKHYDACCEPIHSGKRLAATAEELMRSRYAAFVIADIDYLMRSHHVSTRPIRERKGILKWTKSVTWMGLQIIASRAGTPVDNEGWVEFKATYMQNGRLECIHENSYFVQQKGEWFYKEGVHQ